MSVELGTAEQRNSEENSFLRDAVFAVRKLRGHGEPHVPASFAGYFGRKNGHPEFLASRKLLDAVKLIFHSILI